ncbi:DUF6643 family protein [Streptomyces sp. H27-D2]|uniref:DUF6643 family protein n=1 Tax=Streptomyces sp. H27-D2 TaxID=3046304 RepID=UPI002DB8751B|nr:DUF6643 family protein [Streptomyces sp. H27-D2]MEC4020772.1 DUF6643 family protein [Streptomyces sp. H27-D2]
MSYPRSTYGGGYYAAPSFPDTPIYDSLVAERGTPQIAPIRVPAAYDTGGYLPALPSALPALPAAPSYPSYPSYQQTPPHGYPAMQQQQQGGPLQHAPLQHAPAPYIPQQAGGSRGYNYPNQQAQPQQPRRQAPGTGYEAMRPAAPQPPTPYDDPYGRQYPPRGY